MKAEEERNKGRRYDGTLSKNAARRKQKKNGLLASKQDDLLLLFVKMYTPCQS